jgi:Male sterility protein
MYLTLLVDCRILMDAPNTYAYTKALAEGLVAEKMDTLPAIILRPSVSEYLINQCCT